MVKASKTYLVLLLLFIFSFIYRLLLMFWQGYPPGADIGLHNSVIYSITGSGPTDFFYNFYHIGGGASLTFPGYHIFTAGVMMLTGMTASMEYVAQALVVSLFSSLTVLCAFLITRRIWSTSAAYVVAFLAAISRFDIEMIMWAGYPNVITLMLIPLTFYLYLQKDRFSNVPFLVSTSILAGSLFLTHSLSAGIFVAITIAAVLSILSFPKTLGVTRKTALYWFLPIVFGAILVAPFLMQAIPAYLSDNAYLNGSTGSSVIGSATLSARVLPLAIVLPLFGLIPAYLIFSKQFHKRWVALPAFLLALWVFVCTVLTQGYLVKIPFDYNRFLYFLILPLLVFIAVLIEYAADFLSRIIDTYRTLTQTSQMVVNLRHRRISMGLTRKKLYSIFLFAFLVFSFIALPVLMTPTFTNVGQSIQSFYQTMDNQGWEALQWAKQNTAGNAVFVADAQYGWWFGGFAQRPTLSAVDPQYLSLNREVDNATFARNLLDTDYLIDNGLVQVRDDGGYIARHNPEILADQNWTYYPYSFFTFDSRGTKIEYAINGSTQPTLNVDKLAVKDMHLDRYSDHEEVIVTQGNDYFNYTRTTTVYGGMRFVNFATTLTALVPGVTFNRLDIHVDTNGVGIPYDNKISVGLVDVGTKSFGQLIFNTPPDGDGASFIVENGIVKVVELTYLLGDKAQGQVQLSAAAYSESNNPYYYSSQEAMNQYFLPILNSNLNSTEKPVNASFTSFDYHAELLSRQVSFVALFEKAKAELEVDPKFRYDPLFSPVFINGEVAIFKVNGNLH
jgi:hypothetical protein